MTGLLTKKGWMWSSRRMTGHHVEMFSVFIVVIPEQVFTVSSDTLVTSHSFIYNLLWTGGRKLGVYAVSLFLTN